MNDREKQDLPALSGDAHRHFCVGEDCDNHFVCHQRDGCDNDVFVCPSCEMDERDAHTTELEQFHLQEKPRADHC